MSEIDQFFDSADERAAYEEFCAEQERGSQKFELADPALICRWRMSRRQVPLINRHIRALSQRSVMGSPLTANMLSWAKQHVEWSLAAGDYDEADGVLMLVIDVHGDALMSVGPYAPLSDASREALMARAVEAREEAAHTGVAPELLGVVTAQGRILLAAAPAEALCGSATLVEQLASTCGHEVERVLGAPVLLGDRAFDRRRALDAAVRSASDGAVVFLVSDEHGVVVEDPARAPAPGFLSSAAFGLAELLSQDVAKLFS